MRCAECVYYECFLRTPLGGCQNGASPAVIESRPLPERAPLDITAYANSALLDALKKVKALRDAQNMHAKTLNYGYRCLAIRLGKEVDEMLDKLKIE